MEIRYQFFDYENLFVQKWSGDFSVEDHIKYTKYIMPFLTTTPIKKVLNDFRGVSFGYLDNVPNDLVSTINKITDLRKKIENNELKDKDVSLVFWVDEPMPTLVAHMFIDNFPHKNYSYCLTEKEVSDFLELSPNVKPDLITNNLQNVFK